MRYMDVTAQQLLETALHLPDSQRAELAARLITSLDPVRDADAAAAWDMEICERLSDIDAQRVQLIPWEQARRIIRGEVDGTVAD
jgi:putative addiction module component (TIGR02574 family)